MNKDQLFQNVTNQQQEALANHSASALVVRTETQFLLEILPRPIIKVISGIRRAGKSTLLLSAMKGKDFFYLNFDDELLGQIHAEQLAEVFAFSQKLTPQAEYFVFDEIQNIEAWELFINKLHRQKKNILLTGSNSRLLSSELATHLTGRHITLELFPFSFIDFLKFRKIEIASVEYKTNQQKHILQENFLQYMSQGGFPELLNEAPDSRYVKMYIYELFDKIIGRDLVQRRKIKNVKAIKEIALHMISLYSSQFTFQSVKKASSIHSLNTVKNYVEYLQESYLGFIVEPFSFKIKQRISLPKKFYAIDTLLIDVILGRTSQDRGKKLENIVFLELKRQAREIYYVKQGTYEVDFLIRDGKKITELIQVCWDLSDEKTRQRECKALIQAAKDFGCQKLTIIVFEEHPEIKIHDQIIQVVPVWQWLLNTPSY